MGAPVEVRRLLPYVRQAIQMMIGNRMTSFDERERAFENRFAHDAEKEFRIVARRNRLIGQWAAGLLGLNEAETESYARAVVQADFEEAGDDDVVRKIIGDLLKGGVETSEIQVREAMTRLLADARAQIDPEA